MTQGAKIREARKIKNMTQAQLAADIGTVQSAVSAIEKDEAPDLQPATLIRISDTLDAPEILLQHCQSCPIRQHVLLRYFPELNNIRRDPAVIAARLRKEMAEGIDALDRLGERFSDRDFKSRPDYRDAFEREFEQVIDVKRGIEILEFELLLTGIHTEEELRAVYARQQSKCETKGHHRKVAA